jgi:hypothetical protein
MQDCSPSIHELYFATFGTMNLPFILNVLISVVFIYLVLSLLASEIQELITTLLQWRAKHLRESIQSLISGGSSQESRKVNALINNIYNDPLLKNINQEAHGLVATGFRSLTRLIIPGNRKGAFGSQSTGPSYIDPETFSTVMLDCMGVNHLTAKLVEIRLEKFARRITGDVVMVGDRVEATTHTDATIPDKTSTEEKSTSIWNRAIGLGIDLTGDDRFYHLIENFETIQSDYRNGQAKLSTCVERIAESLDYFISSYPEDGDDRLRTFVDRVKRDKLSLFGANNERAWITGGLEPSVADIADLVDKGSSLHREVRLRYENLRSTGEELQQRVLSRKSTYLQQCSGLSEESMATFQPSEEDEQACLGSALNELTPEEFRIYQDYQTYQRVDRTLDHLPKALKDSLGILARRAQNRAHETSNTVQHFQQEISTWFDRSMGRTSGVYKRNAKGVALIIGLTIAMFTNSDTFHIFSRVASDDSLRKVITDRASQIAPKNEPTGNNVIRQDLNELKDQTQEVLSDIPLPITWNPRNLSQQLDCPYEPKTDDLQKGQDKIYSLLTQDQWNDLYRACLNVPNASTAPIPMQVVEMIMARPLGFLRMFSGWWISGVAIAMGAPFWFDLLGKIVNVRNAGSKPKS